MLSESKKHILCNPQACKWLTQLKTARANSGWKAGMDDNPDWPADEAAQHDHYLYGRSKKP